MQKKRFGNGLWRMSQLRALLHRKKKENAAEEEHIRRFCRSYAQVLAGSGLVSPGEEMSAVQLARRYMRHVLGSGYDAQWWRENEEYLAQPWFIWHYAGEHGIVQRPAEPQEQTTLRVLTPENQTAKATVMLRLERDVRQPERGLIHIHCAPDELPEELARRLRCKVIPGGCVRKVDECAAPMMERGVQMGVMLLEAGYAVCVQEQRLHDRILAAEYEHEHQHWIRATEAAEWLQLTYPFDAVLHGYLLKLGGKWTGKQMLLPLTASGRMRDIVRLYGFRVTEEAKRRLDMWEAARQQATIFSARRAKNTPPNPRVEDRFREMLAQEAEIPEDLIDQTDG